jgi:hypothetical protein
MFGVTAEVSAPALGFGVVLAVAAAAAEADKPTARTVPAATVSTGKRLRQYDDPAATPADRAARLRIQEKACMFI